MSYRESESVQYLEHLQRIGREDAEGLKKAQASYGNSWKSRGGVGAFMMLARKWDRLENRIRKAFKFTVRVPDGADFTSEDREAPPWDIFKHTLADTRSEGLIDDIRDLRRYLMLVEAELRVQGSFGKHRDNKEESNGGK